MGQGSSYPRTPVVRLKTRDLEVSAVRAGCYPCPAICCRTWEDSMSSRRRNGSVVQDKRDRVWRFFWWENGKRRAKTLGRFSTKAAAWQASKPLRDALEAQPTNDHNNCHVPTV